MKKIILTVLVTLGVAALACGFIIKGINEAHVKEIDELGFDHQIEIDAMTNERNNTMNEYRCVIEEYCAMQEEIEELYEQVYNMQNGEPYEITIEHDGETHVWSSENKSIFSSETHMVVY